MRKIDKIALEPKVEEDIRKPVWGINSLSKDVEHNIKNAIQEKLYTLFNPQYKVNENELPLNKIETQILEDEGPQLYEKLNKRVGQKKKSIKI